MIRIGSIGSFKKTLGFLDRLKNGDIYKDLDRYGSMGVNALSSATPRRTGATASAWSYVVQRNSRTTTIMWTNSNVNKGAQIAILLQYGHGTGTGGYVAGYDYINPVMRPVFDKIAIDVWKKVTDG